jgi:hypothetical protein
MDGDESEAKFVSFSSDEIELRTNDLDSQHENTIYTNAPSDSPTQPKKQKLLSKFSASFRQLRPALPKDEEERKRMGPLTLLLVYRRIPVKLILDIVIAIFLFVLVRTLFHIDHHNIHIGISHHQ